MNNQFSNSSFVSIGVQNIERELVKKANESSVMYYIRLHIEDLKKPLDKVKEEARAVAKKEAVFQKKLQQLLVRQDLRALKLFLKKNRLSESEEYQVIARIFMDCDDEVAANLFILDYLDSHFCYERTLRLIEQLGIYTGLEQPSIVSFEPKPEHIPIFFGVLYDPED